ncbi:hypothetical protein [Krasilnikovia sp. MM14-A1004]|uniref:hypothetical protein n=1 Tax=Krasilnikovia sp. MM14-A1004 TaxID=3373541 RepID=UPI00399C9F31
MSEPSPDSPLVRTTDTDGFHNPILYIEELRRFPLAGCRVPAPGTAMVFRGRSGRLHAPPGGYTAGEMVFLGPRTGYRIDVSPHAFTAVFEVEEAVFVEVGGRWRVTDPVAVVAHRVSDLEYACTAELRRRIAAAASTVDTTAVDSAAVVRGRLRAAWADGVRVPGGVRLADLRVDATLARLRDRMARLLVADDEEPDPADPGGADPGQLLQELRGLARDGLAAHGTDGPAGRALVRFHELVTRMGDILPGTGEQTHDDR